MSAAPAMKPARPRPPLGRSLRRAANSRFRTAATGAGLEVDAEHAHLRMSANIEAQLTGVLYMVLDQISRSIRSGNGAMNSAVLAELELENLHCLLTRRTPEAAPAERVAQHPAAAPPRSGLSPREEEIARMVAKGYPNKTIAAVLEISPWTVCTHLRRIFAKLDVRSRAAMVARLLAQ